MLYKGILREKYRKKILLNKNSLRFLFWIGKSKTIWSGTFAHLCAYFVTFILEETLVFTEIT